jgi:hydrogenase expression/formation protein HypE
MTALPTGKLPPDLLARLLARAPGGDPRVVLGPGIGLDCAVIAQGDTLLVYKSDPITFATDEIGWYLVHVNANDIATTGATPRWLLVTALLPEGHTTAEDVESIAEQVYAACREIGVAVIGGHTEIAHGLDRPILAGTLIGEVSRERLVTPRGAVPGNRVLLTKGVPIEATAILAREFPERLTGVLSAAELERARAFLHDPGISVLRDARIALAAGRVTAMHDPTEGGLAGALWELAEASGHALVVDAAAVPVPELSARICRAFGFDPLAAIASGALLLTAPAADAPAIRRALEVEGIPCAEIGVVEDGPAGVNLPRPERDEIAKAWERETRRIESGTRVIR